MAKKLNKKVAVIGIIILAMVVIASAAMGIRYLYQRNPERNLEIARQAMANGDYKRAESAFGRAYAYGKTDAWKIERLFEMADFHLIHNDKHEANWPKALRCWNTVLNIDPKNLPARRKMLKYFYEMGDSGSVAVWKNVHDNAAEMIDIVKEKGIPVDTELLDAFGRASLSIAQRGGIGNRNEYLTQAIASFESLVEQEPTKASHYSYLADAVFLRGELNAQAGVMNAREEARQTAMGTLDQAVQKADNKAAALAARYSYEIQSAGNEPDSIEKLRADLENLIKTTAPDAKLMTVLSQAYELPGKASAEAELNRAIEAARQAARLAPDEFEYSYRLAMLLYRKGSAFEDAAATEDAVTLAEEMKTMPQTQDIPGPRQGRNIAYRNALNIFLAKCYLEKAAEQPDKADLWTKKTDPLVAQITQYFGSSENAVVQQWEGLLAIAKGNRDMGIRLLYRAYEQTKALDAPDQPSTIDPILCTTLAHIAGQSNQVGLQREFLEKTLSNRTRLVLDKPSLILDYAELMGRFQGWNRAVSFAQTYQQRYGANARSQHILAEAALALGETAQVMQAIAALPDNSPEQKLLELRFVSSQIGQTLRLTAQLEAERKPLSDETLKTLENLRSRQKQLLLDLIETAPEKIDVPLLRSVCVHNLQTQKTAEAITLLDAYLSRKPDAVVLKILRRQADEPNPLAVSGDRYTAIQLEVIESLSDPKQKAMAKAEVFRANREYEKALDALRLAAEADKNNDADVVDEQFQIALEREDIKAAEDLQRTLRTRNLDGCEGNLAAAQVELLKKNYPLALRRADECLTMRPLMSFGHYLKSRIYQQMENRDAAIEGSQRSIQMDPLNSLYAKNHASLLFNRNTALGARVTPDQQNELLQALTMAMVLNPADWQLQSVYAETIGAQAPDRALAIRQQLLQNYPSVPNAVMLGNMALKMAQAERNAAKKTGLIELSGKAYARAMELEPNNENAKAAYAEYLRQTRQSEKAEELLRGDKNLLWRYYLQNGQFDKAEELLTELHKADAKDSSVLRGLVMTAESTGNRAAQKKHLDLLSALDHEKDDELWLIQKYLDGGFSEDAEKRVAGFKEQYPDEKLVLLLDAWSKMINGHLNDALTLTNRYLESDSSNAGAWRLRGRLYRLMNDPRKAVDDLQRSKSLTPNPAISMELATVFSEMGQTDTAIGELVNGLQDPLAPVQMRVMLESLYQRSSRAADLERFYAQTLEQFPNSPFWALRAGQYYLSRKDIVRAMPYLKATWDSIRRQGLLDPTALNLYLEALVQNRQYNDVFTVTTELIDGPLAPIAYAHMAQSQFKQNQVEKAESFFFTALDKSGVVDLFQETTLSIMLKTIGQDAALRWAQKNPNALPNLLLSYRLALNNEQYNRGIELIDQCLAGTGPDNPEWGNFTLKKVNLLVQAFMKTRDRDYMSRAIGLFRQILGRYPESPSILNNLAYLLAVNDEQLDQALLYARQAHQKEPGNPVYLDTYAYTQYKNGQFEQARQNLLRSIQLYEVNREPTPWDVYNHLGLVQESLNDSAGAMESFRKALDATAEAPEKERKMIEERINKLKQQANI